MNIYSPLDERILIHGRTVKKEPLPLFWTGAGIELETDAAELWLELENTGYTGLLWIRAELDGVTVLRQAVERGVSRVCVFRGVPAVRRRVRLFREQQPFPREPDCVLRLRSVQCDGALYPVPPRPRRIEFVGDSVTAGEGLCGPASLLSGGPIVYSSQGNYALEAGRALNADVNLVALSGWGAAVSWDNNPHNVTPRVYREVCSAIPDPDGQKPWDFAAWQPDAVIIHLGNNDFFALKEAPYTDPATGAVTRFGCGPDGRPDEASARAFHGAVTGFLAQVRAVNPRARLVWAFGMFTDLWRPYIEAALEDYTRATGDRNVSFLPLPRVRPENTGSNGHPGPLDHLAAARAVTEHLNCLQKP